MENTGKYQKQGAHAMTLDLRGHLISKHWWNFDDDDEPYTGSLYNDHAAEHARQDLNLGHNHDDPFEGLVKERSAQ